MHSDADRGDPARMRAIPNNAILQQFGYVANVVAGLGAAVGSERERFVELAKRSPRLRPLHRDDRARQAAVEPQRHGRQRHRVRCRASGPGAPPGAASRTSRRRSRSLAALLLSDDRDGEINSLVHHLRLDAIELHAMLEEIGIEGGKIPDDTGSSSTSCRPSAWR